MQFSVEETKRPWTTLDMLSRQEKNANMTLPKLLNTFGNVYKQDVDVWIVVFLHDIPEDFVFQYISIHTAHSI